MIKPINGYTKQTMIERILKYNNGHRAEAPAGCLYETEDGNRCAIGCFIPANHPALKFYGDVNRLLRKYPDLRDHMPIDKYLLNFQQSHDGADDDSTARIRIIRWINDNVADNA